MSFTISGATALVRGYALGSLAMTCYGVGAAAMPVAAGAAAAPLPPGVPPEQTNI